MHFLNHLKCTFASSSHKNWPMITIYQPSSCKFWTRLEKRPKLGKYFTLQQQLLIKSNTLRLPRKKRGYAVLFWPFFFLKASLLSNSKADGTQLPIYKTGRKCHPTSRLPHQLDACVGSIKSLFPHLQHPPIWTLWRRRPCFIGKKAKKSPKQDQHVPWEQQLP